jgi:hypothetical protein
VNCSVYLYPTKQDARDGANYGGSGFMVAVPFITEDIINKESIGLGDEVFMVGRFISHDGK